MAAKRIRNDFKKIRRAKGLCTRCGESWDGDSNRCPECRLRDTLQARARRRRKTTPRVDGACTMCREPGHYYTTCLYNPTSLQ